MTNLFSLASFQRLLTKSVMGLVQTLCDAIMQAATWRARYKRVIFIQFYYWHFSALCFTWPASLSHSKPGKKVRLESRSKTYFGSILRTATAFVASASQSGQWWNFDKSTEGGFAHSQLLKHVPTAMSQKARLVTRSRPVAFYLCRRRHVDDIKSWDVKYSRRSNSFLW